MESKEVGDQDNEEAEEEEVDGLIANRDGAYKLSKAQFIELLKQEIEKQDPVDGICNDLEEFCEISEDGLVDFDEMMRFFESVNWLEASKDAIMAVADRHKTDDNKIDYRVALHNII